MPSAVSVLSAALVLGCAHVAASSWTGPLSVDGALDCALRSLAWEYGQHLGGLLGAAPAMASPFRTLFDALRLSEDCGTVPPPLSSRSTSRRARRLHDSVANATYYADPVHGNDNNAGTFSSPFLTIERALSASRVGPTPAAIVLREGTFFLQDTLVLTPGDSGLSISAFSGESATLSAGAPLVNLSWVRSAAPPSPPLSQPVTGSLLAWNGSSCVSDPGDSHPDVCVPLGRTSDAVACAQACMSSAACTGYTWHDNSTGAWYEWCYARLDGYDAPDHKAGHVSGWKIEPVVIWSAQVPQSIGSFDQLFYWDGKRTLGRAVRSRWPNANPEIDIAPVGYTSAAEWLPPAAFPPPREVHLATPNRSSYDPFFPFFQWGWEGTVGNFTTGSFWGTHNPPAGAQFKVPTGVVMPQSAPNVSSWDLSAAVVHALHCDSWGDWAFSVDPFPSVPINGTLKFSRGGWQEARGCASGAGFFVENIPQLLDASGEWYFDAQTRTLTMAFNESSPPTANGTFLIASQLVTILNVTGSALDPVVGIQIGPNLTFSHTSVDFDLPYMVPSGGDWSFRAGGAVTLIGTSGANVQGCTFSRVGGNGLFIGGFGRRCTVQANEFSFTGASAIVVAGFGGDGVTGGLPDYPEGTTVAGNLGRELGVFVKQSGFLYSAVSANHTITGNVFFNGPRAGININDGFGGGHVISANLACNFVRETSDHGVVNTWDREVYAWRAWNITALQPLLTHISGNFFINNYHSVWPIDRACDDDGSNGYVDSNNVLLWGGSKNYLGFNKAQIGNFYVYPDYSPLVLHGVDAKLSAKLGNGYGTCAVSSAGTAAFPVPLRDTWFNNTCLQSKSADLFAFGACQPEDPNNGHIPVLANNTYATGDDAYLLKCGNETWNLTTAQAAGIEIGSQLVPLPNTQMIVAFARQMLGF